MTNLTLSILWGFLYAVCAIAGFVPEPVGILYWLLVAASVAFFVPPAVLLARAAKSNNRKILKNIRALSLTWLIVAMVMIVCNILSITASQLTGRVLYYAMVILTSPMVCGQNWFVSLFLWACLLTVSIQLLKKSR